MKRPCRVACVVVLACSFLDAGVSGQTAFSGSTPAGAVTADPLLLTMRAAVARGLEHNLGIIVLEEQVESARGARIRSLRDLMPRVDARAADTRQTTNLAAFGFDASLFPGVPPIVGPYNIFDARVFGSQPLFDLSALNDVRSSTYNLTAARLDSQNARDVVAFVVTDLYLRAAAAAARIDAIRSQVSTADALLTLATNQRNAGATTGIDVLRAHVQLQAQRQRLIAAENDYAKQTLQLVRAIGVPVAQGIELADRGEAVPLVAASLDEAVRRAVDGRADYRASLERVHAAEASLRAASTEGLPSVHVNADVGAIGPTPGDARRTYAISGSVRMSVFDRDHKGRQVESAARLRQRRAEAADFAQKIEAEVRTAFLDVGANEQQLALVTEQVSLAEQELALARTRFSAGVTSNLEVIQAQTELAGAQDRAIAGAYAFNAAKAALARAVGSPVSVVP
jgi:outer membrane protein TolC